MVAELSSTSAPSQSPIADRHCAPYISIKQASLSDLERRTQCAILQLKVEADSWNYSAFPPLHPSPHSFWKQLPALHRSPRSHAYAISTSSLGPMGLKSRIFCRTSVDPAVQRFYVHKNERLGKGNFALSFRATDRVDNSAVACKCFKLGKSKVIGSEILNEVQFLQELEHPNIVRMLAHGVSGREYVIVLEMLSKNLLQIVTESHGLPMPQALQYSRDILCGLAHCHSRGILHRDVKLENIMVDDKTGLVKLIDFGLSCTLDALSTDANPFVGTTSYLAPEVLDRKPYSFGCDIWSLGVVFFTMIFNVFPFKMAHSVDLEFRKLSDLQKEGRKNSVCNALGSKCKATEAPESITTILDSFLAVDPTQRQPADELMRLVDHAGEPWELINSLMPTSSKRGSHAHHGCHARADFRH